MKARRGLAGAVGVASRAVHGAAVVGGVKLEVAGARRVAGAVHDHFDLGRVRRVSVGHS